VIEALGNIGDFIGGIGVIITLLYLASQIRQNTRSMRAAAFQTSQRDVIDKLDSLSSDPELVRIYFDGNHEFGSFSREDRRRYAAFMTGLIRRYETLLYQTRVGNIDREEWEGVLDELHRIFKYPGARAWWTQASGSFNRELRDFIEREVLSSEPHPPAA